MKGRRKNEETCYYCKFAYAYGWHLWHCTKHDEPVSAQGTCPEWEEE